jgi:3-oxoacyl-[acyl-carrier-protein] synthase-1
MIRIIADNIFSPLGFTTADNYAAVKAGRSMLQHHEGMMGLPQPFTASLFDWREVERIGDYTRFETIAILSAREALRHTSVDPASPDVLFVIASTKGNVELLEDGNIVMSVFFPSEGDAVICLSVFLTHPAE